MKGKGAVFDVVCCKSRKNDYIGGIPFCVSPLAGLSVTKETIMSFWAVLFGLLGAVSVCAASFFNDRILKQTYLVGNSMPVSVYGVFIVFVALINPFLGKRRLSAGQIAVVMAIALAGCPIPGSGLLRTFTSSLIMPVRYQQTEASWREHKILDLVPERMLPDYKSNDKVVEGFSAGLGEGDKHVAWKDVPWKEWKRPIVFWTPMIMVLWFAMIALGLMLHQQWSSHEHIPYPIAGFVDSLLPEEGSLMSPVFKDRFFWVGLIAVICIHLNNYLCVWFPEELIPVKLTLPLWGFGKVFPVIVRGGGGGLFGPVIYFCVIGICFLIPSDISFTFALAPWLWAFVCGMLVKYGITLTQTIEGSYWYNCLNAKMFLLYGSTLGLFLTICYTGRHYYWHVIKTAIGLKRGEGAAPAMQTWGCRIFLLCMVYFIGNLVYAGMDWQLAIMYAGVIVIFYVVMTRIICESGLFHLQLNVFPCCIIWGILGSINLGPTTLLLMQLISVILICDPRESLMPFMMNSLKVLERRKQPLGKTSAWCGIAMVIGLVVALSLTLYIQYDQGSAIWESWAEECVPRMHFNNAIAVKQKLMAQGTLEQAEAVSGWGRFAHMQPNATCMWCLGIGLALVLLFSAARLHFTWWPLHPMLFVTWNTPHMPHFAGSFFIGWVIKKLVIKYGGTGVYNRARPFMIGLIAGEIFGAILPSIVAAIYYVVTNGEMPKAFHVLLS